jgi:Flp pilus assembly protein TadB
MKNDQRSPSEQNLYTTGGTIAPTSKIYVTRQADEELFQNCMAGKLSYVLTARQMGKSSLMVRTMERLRAEDLQTVIIDLTSGVAGESLRNMDQFYIALLKRISRQLNLGVQAEGWWEQQGQSEGEAARFHRFLRDEVLERIATPVVIFIDEIDSIRSLTEKGFPVDDFFAVIRAIYNERAIDPVYQRLTFVLLGVAEPSDLIDDLQRTPFNIGARVILSYFSEDEATALGQGLKLPEARRQEVIRWVLDWTGGHPYLSHRICAELAVAELDGKAITQETVNEIVDRLFIHAAHVDANLKFVDDWLTRTVDRTAYLTQYYRILYGLSVSANTEDNPYLNYLKLTQIVQPDDGTRNGNLVVSNRIYATYFDRAWVSERLSERGLVTIEELEQRFRESLAEEKTSKAPIIRSAEAPRPAIVNRLQGFWQSIQSVPDDIGQAQAGRAVPRRRFAETWKAEIARANANLTVAEYAALHILFMTGTFLVVYFVIAAGNMPGAVLLATIGFFMPRIILWMMMSARLRAFEQQLPDILSLWVNSLRSGLTVYQSLEVIARNLPQPAAGEFKRLLREMSLTVNPDDAYRHIMQRIPSVSLELAITAIQIQRDVGGNLAEILEVVSSTIRDRVRVAGERTYDVMPLHRYLIILIGVLAVLQTATFETYFGLADSASGEVALFLAHTMLIIAVLIAAFRHSGYIRQLQRFGLDDRVRLWRAVDLLVGSAVVAVMLLADVPILSAGLLLVLVLATSLLTPGESVIGFMSILLAGSLTYLFLPEQGAIFLALLAAIWDAIPPSVSTVAAEIFLAFPGIMALVGFLLLFSVLGFGFWGLSVLPFALYSRDPVGARIRQMQQKGFENIDLEEAELSVSFRDRILIPLMRQSYRLLYGLSPLKFPADQAERLRKANINRSPGWFYAIQIILMIAGGLFAYYASTERFLIRGEVRWVLIWGFVPFVAVCLGHLPQWELRRLAHERQQEVDAVLPDVTDFLVTFIEAGQSFDAGMDAISQRWTHALASELGRTVREIQLGKPRGQSLQALSTRMDVDSLTTFLGSIIQAEQLGVSLGRNIRVQSDQLRLQRRQRLADTAVQENRVWFEFVARFLVTTGVTLWMIAPIIGRVVG